ncbi:MAG TPA: SpoIIE family protein phosphatase, partial [Bacteroidia bacterium]|nr:SpoIIE family protein phosphatase [Bacteroidia bacterium]
VYVGMADIYNGHKNFEEGLKNLFAGLKIFETIGDEPDYGMTSIAIGTVYGQTKKYPEALDYLNKGLKIALEVGSKEDIKAAYKALSDVYSQTKDYKKAFESYEQYSIYKDSLYSEDKNKEIGKLEAKSEFDLQKGISDAEHRKEIEKRDELAAAADQRKNVIIFSITLGLVLVAIFLVFLFNRFRVTKKQKQIIELKNKETEHQKEIIEEKQKEIIDSINYAKRIQYALLAHEQLLKENLVDHFVFFKPKDIVSGDFYWATKTVGGRQSSERFYLAVCDSTGHGVPGAFMSLLNISYLNEAVIEKNIAQPNEILNHVRQRLIENISSSRDASGGGQDGMDAILICIDKTNNKLTYAAAHNSPVIVQNGAIKTLDADKMPVGKGENMNDFTLHTIDIQKGDSLYLYTDGYADQFGGVKGKKFKYKQLNELILAGSASAFETQKDILSKRLDEWKGDLEQVDDVCMIGIRF